MSMCVTPRWDTASTTAFWMAGVEPMVPDSPMPLAPSGLRGLSVCGVRRLEAAQLGRRRDRVVGQVRRDGVAVLVVQHLLVQRLRRALGDAAVLLAANEQRVEDAAAVVDGDVAQHRDAAGLGVDLDDRDVRAERERRVGAVEVELVAQRARLEAVGQLRRVLRRRRRAPPTTTALDGTPATCRPPSPTTMSSGEASSRCAAICLARSSTPSDATWMALPAVCSEREPSVPEPRGTRDGVGVDERDLVHRDAEHVAGQHRERGVVALAVHAGAGEHAWPSRRRGPRTAPHSMCRPTGAVTSTYVDTPMPSCLVSPRRPARRLLGAQLVVARRRRARRRAPSRTRPSRSWRR